MIRVNWNRGGLNMFLLGYGSDYLIFVLWIIRFFVVAVSEFISKLICISKLLMIKQYTVLLESG